MLTGLLHNSSTPDRSGSYFKAPLVHGFLIVILCIIAYSNAFSVPFQFDDSYNITNEPLVRGHSFVKVLALTRGVGYLTFMLNYRLHGADVVGYHIVNLVIHALNALFLYGIIALSFRTPALLRSSLRHYAGVIALFSSFLFAVHPVQTEAVTYIVQRFASLATLFYLGSLAAYIRSRLSALESRSKWKTTAWYAVSLVSAVLAMKTKEISFTLPVIISLYEFLFFEGTIKKRIFLLLPLLLTMIIIPMSLLGTAKPLGSMINDLSETIRVQTDMPRMEYLFTEFAVVATYLRLLFFPYHQDLDYDYPLFQSFFAPEVFLSFLLLALIFGSGVYLLHRDRRSAGIGRLIAFGIFWFFIALSVESSVIPITDVIFEHRLYLPSAGFFIAVTCALCAGAEKLKRRWPWTGPALTGALVVSVIVFTGLTVARNTVWQNEVSLWENVVRNGPEKARGYNGLGLAYQHASRYDKAIENYGKAIALAQDYAAPYVNRGVLQGQAGLFDKAIEDFNHAVAINPAFAEAYSDRGIVYALSGRYDRAVDDFNKALALNQNLAEAYFNRGKLYLKKGQKELATADFQQACNSGYENACGDLHGPER
jgi:tetratricopeptide (TPR) repeat protein